MDKAEFLADVTVPDGTDFAPGATFVKTWRVKNAGTSTWANGYVFVFAKGDRLGGPDSLPIAGPVPPGGTLELSVNLAAPDKLGSYTGFWQFRSAAGQPFGIGPDGNQPVYVQIDVTAAGGATAEPTGVAGPLQVSAVSLTVDRPSVSDTCPQTFRFSGTITSAGAGSMTYRLEATSETPGFQYVLPDTTTSTFGGPGPRTLSVSYDLVFSGSVTGQVWLHVLSPNEVNSAKVSFSLNCQGTPNAP